jgi:hypothetical protein
MRLWLDNEAAAESLQRIEQIDGPVTARIHSGPRPLIHPAGTVNPAQWARTAPQGDGFRTAFPVPGGL